MLARERGQPVLRVTAARGETVSAQEPVKPSREPGASAGSASPDARPTSGNAALSRAAQTARAAAGASIEDRVRARVQQATLAVLGPERAHATPRSPARVDTATAAPGTTSASAAVVRAEPVEEPVAEPGAQSRVAAARPPERRGAGRAAATPRDLARAEARTARRTDAGAGGELRSRRRTALRGTIFGGCANHRRQRQGRDTRAVPRILCPPRIAPHAHPPPALGR